MHTTPLGTCNACDGFLPPNMTQCPHCGHAHNPPSKTTTLLKRIGRTALSIGGGALVATTLMACYGAPYDSPCEEADNDLDGDCVLAEDDCDDTDQNILAPEEGEDCQQTLHKVECAKACSSTLGYEDNDRLTECRTSCQSLVSRFGPDVGNAISPCIEITETFQGENFDACILDQVYDTQLFPVQITIENPPQNILASRVLLHSETTTTLSKQPSDAPFQDTSQPFLRATPSTSITVLFDMDQNNACNTGDLYVPSKTIKASGDYENISFSLSIDPQEILEEDADCNNTFTP